MQQREGRDVPLPDPRKYAQNLLLKLTPHDDLKVYLQTFNQTAECEGWPRREWSTILVPLLLWRRGVAGDDSRICVEEYNEGGFGS